MNVGAPWVLNGLKDFVERVDPWVEPLRVNRV